MHLDKGLKNILYQASLAGLAGAVASIALVPGSLVVTFTLFYSFIIFMMVGIFTEIVNKILTYVSYKSYDNGDLLDFKQSMQANRTVFTHNNADI